MKLAIVGTGMIVGEALEALQHCPLYEIVAICSGPHNKEKAKQLAKIYHIPNAYTDYAQMLRETSAETIYIGIVNSAHYLYGIQALEANKNVIMEKPFTATYDEAMKLAEIAKQKHLYIFEAVTFLHSNSFDDICMKIRKLGVLSYIQCNYSKYSSRYDRYLNHDIAPAFNPELAGGALLDLNIYNLHYAAFLLGKPQKISYVSELGYNGIDLAGTAIISYPKAIASCTAAKNADSPCFRLFQSGRNYLLLNGSPDDFQDATIHMNNETWHLTYPIPKYRMLEEFERFHTYITSQDYSLMIKHLDHTLVVMKMADECSKTSSK